jgi:hypothetical protein
MRMCKTLLIFRNEKSVSALGPLFNILT